MPTTGTADCPCCCPCDITLERELHGTCTTPADSDVVVDPTDCDDEPTGGTHTFGSSKALRYRHSTEITFTADESVECGVDDPLGFAVWTIEGDTSCIGNLTDFSGPGGGGEYCYYGTTLRIELCANGACDLTLTVHYAEVPTVFVDCACVNCYLEDIVNADCPDDFSGSWTPPC